MKENMIPYYEQREVNKIKDKIKDLTDYMNEPFESQHYFGSKALRGDYYKCKKCKHDWATRNHAGKSAKCPSCSSVNIVNTSILSRKEAKKKHLKEISDLKKEVKAFEKKYAKEIQAEKKEQLRKEREIKKRIAEQKRRDEEHKKFIEKRKKEFEKKLASMNTPQQIIFRITNFAENWRNKKSFWIHFLTWLFLPNLIWGLLVPEWHYASSNSTYVIKSFAEAVGISIGYTFFFGYPIVAITKKAPAKLILGIIFIIMLALWVSGIGL